jgi:hypothetical protein
MRGNISELPGHPGVIAIELEGDCNEQAIKDGRFLKALVEFLEKHETARIAIKPRSTCHFGNGVYATTLLIGKD